MPDDKTNEPQKAAEAPTYTVERLLAESNDFLDVDRHVAAGAFATIRKKHLTLEEAGKAIKDFQKRQVEVDNLLPTRTNPNPQEG